ncbi:MAG: hypothetical protein U5K38_10700 [Woeseiaceae bacterium]|nr:hypothetical protein [Woeseiaceae bacterium]
MLANLDQYIAALEAFSKPIRERTDWNPDTADISARGNDSYLYRYYDATVQAEFLYGALERTVEEDLEREIAFLLGFDRAHRELNAFMDWPDKDLDLFIRLVHQNGFKLSTNKRASHFGWMKEEELATAEGVVAEAFRAGDTHDQ